MAVEDDYGMIDGIVNNGPKQTSAASATPCPKAGISASHVEAVRREQVEQKGSAEAGKETVRSYCSGSGQRTEKTARSKVREGM